MINALFLIPVTQFSSITLELWVSVCVRRITSVPNNDIYVSVQPLEGFQHLAEQTFQGEHFLHQEAFHSCLLSAGGVNALSRLPPHQDLMLEFWTHRAGEAHSCWMHVKHKRSLAGGGGAEVATCSGGLSPG